MKYLALIICLLLIIPSKSSAQHCPFDGGRLIAVHLTDAKGNPVGKKTEKLSLVEVNNPAPDSCTYAEGPLKKNFEPTKSYLQNRYERYWDHWIEPDYKDWILFNPGYYAIVLNQAETNCMIKKDGDFVYRPRQFEVQFQIDNQNQIVKVPENKIYSLCTNNGSWKRIIPLEIKLEK
ncbi:MAG: hypothetical protein K1X72_10245 [Pyrinomonadaceae bacterium]|nr:hypothetical protein [Pyrinomonadaceae bacterium]